MQARRRAQPSRTNSPSSYPHPTGGTPYIRIRVSRRHGQVDRGPSEKSLCGPQGTRGSRVGRPRAAHRSAAIACGARPVPFRTRKLSRTAPMVLRGKPVGEQGAADRWTALAFFHGARAGGLRPPFFNRLFQGGAPAPPFFISRRPPPAAPGLAIPCRPRPAPRRRPAADTIGTLVSMYREVPWLKQESASILSKSLA